MRALVVPFLVMAAGAVAVASWRPGRSSATADRTGDTSQWNSAIIEGTKPIEAEEQRGPNATHLDELLADKAANWIRVQHAMAPDKPFFAYYAPGTAHAPLHAPKEWIATFKGQFDQGWDKVREETFARQKKLGVIPADAQLTPRPESIPVWESLNADGRRSMPG